MKDLTPRSSDNWLEEVLAEGALLLFWFGAIAVLSMERM